MKSYKFKINNNDFSVDITSVEDNIINLEVNGTAFQVEMEKTLKPVTKTPRVVSNPTVSQNAKTAPVASAAVSKVEAPLPGVILSVNVKEGIKFIALIPKFKLSTEKARAILPSEVTFNDCIYNISRAALLISVFANGNYELLEEANKDKIHQPFRSKLIKDFDIVYNKAIELGGLSCH